MQGVLNKEQLRAAIARSGRSSEESSVSRYLKGFSRREASFTTPTRQDHQGYVFFTKPLANVTTANLRSSRRLVWLTDPDPLSPGCAVKCMIGANPALAGVGGVDGQVRSAHIDDESPFIPMLTSAITSLTGWPDRITEYFQSDEGIAKEVHGYVDNRPDLFGTYDLTATFRNMDGDFINGWVQSLWEYQASVAEGSLMPYPAMITARELDYNVRIYRVILDNTKTYVRKIACTGASILGADTAGADFNFTSEQVLVNDNTEISVPFKCFGAWYNDPIAIFAFNLSVMKMNWNMRDENRVHGNGRMVKLKGDERYLADTNGIGYPYINEETFELEWWVTQQQYDDLMSLVEVQVNPRTQRQEILQQQANEQAGDITLTEEEIRQLIENS